MATATAPFESVSIRSVLRDRRPRRFGAIILVAVFLGAGLWLLRWWGDDSRATPDTFWYARDAFQYAGYPEPAADLIAAHITCRAYVHARDSLRYDSCLRYRSRLPHRAPPRFRRIFTSRPGYALLTSPFIRVFGRAGFAIGTGTLGVACGVAIVALALAAGLRPAQAFAAEVLFYLLPTGLWVSRLLAEAPMVLCLFVALIGAIRLAADRTGGLAARLPAAGLLAAGLSCLCVVKPANGVALAGALALVAAARLPFGRARHGHLLIGAVAVVVLTGNLLVSAVLRLPGVDETLQDAFTRHFHKPDVEHPWQLLGALDLHVLEAQITPHLISHPLIPAGYLFGALGLFGWTRFDAALPIACAGLTGVGVIAMHPLITETARLTVVTWIPVAIGLAALAGLRDRRGRVGS